SDATVADRVRERLEPTPLEPRDHLRELLRRVEGVAARLRSVRVRVEERGRVRLDDVVDVELDRRDAEPVVVEVAFRVLELVELLRGRSARMEERGDQPGAEPSLVAGSLEMREVIDRV